MGLVLHAAFQGVDLPENVKRLFFCGKFDFILSRNFDISLISSGKVAKSTT